MSLTSKIAFGLCCTTSIGIIGYVHYKQEYDRNQLHAGVVRDLEQQQRRKAENFYVLQKQQELTRQLRQQEDISNNNI